MSSLFGGKTKVVPIQIVARSVIKDKNIYTLQAGTITRFATELGLYDIATLEGLIAAGYKIIGYNGNIQSPDGVCIKDIMETPCTASQSAIDFAFELGDYALSEQEAATYFCRDVEITAVEFKQGTDEIKTREELENYLANWDRARRYGLALDYRPLNSFVAKEALYEISELADERVARFYEIICKRRRFPDYSRFEQMVAFLLNAGVLKLDYNMDDILKAYMSWGVCGIKTPVISVDLKIGATCGIYNKIQTSSGKGVLNKEIVLMDSKGVLTGDDGSYDLSVFEDDIGFGESKIKPADVLDDKTDATSYLKSVYFQNKKEPWDKPYKALEVSKYVSHCRTYVKFLDSDGVSYEGRYEPTGFCITTVSGSFRLLAHGDFFVVLGVDGTPTPLNKCDTRDHYALWQILKAKVYDLVRSRTKEPPVKSSFELFLKEGVSPAAATAWAGYILENDPAQETKGVCYSRADALYKEGPDKKYIRLFNPNNYDYANIDELTEIFKATREEMTGENVYLMPSGNPDEAARDSVIERAMVDRPVELLEFAKGFKEGEINVGHFAEGLQKDGMVDYDKLTRFLWSYVSVAGITEVNTVRDAMLDLESNKFFDVDKVFKYREAAYQGYLKDRAELNGKRASDCVNAVVVTKVFREGSNAPIDTQRHYMFECVMLDLSGKGKTPKGEWRNNMVFAQNTIAEAIVRAVNKSSESDLFKECIQLESMSLALNVMFSLMQGSLGIIGNLMDNAILRAKFYGKEFEIVIPIDVYDISRAEDNYQWGAQCTLYDWCGMELPGNQWCMYCLNADITPWEVRPKGDLTIPTYNFKLNYILPEVFDKLPESYRKDVAAAAIKPKVLCIQKSYRGRTLVPADELDFIVYNDSNIESVLDIDVSETPEEYYKRILAAMKKKSEGLYLKRVPLKSDIIYKNWWNCFYDGIAPSDVEWADSPNDMGLGFLTFQVTQIGCKSERNKITSNENIFKRWFIAAQKYEDVAKWFDLICGTFKPQGAVVVTGNRIDIQTVNGKLQKNAKELTLDEAIKLTEKGLAYQLAAREFVFLSRGQYYYLQVM